MGTRCGAKGRTHLHSNLCQRHPGGRKLRRRIKAPHRDAPEGSDNLDVWMRGRIVFCSLEASASSAHRLLSHAVPVVPVLTAYDEAHMVTLDMTYRPAFRSSWTLGSCFGSRTNTLLLTATLRPALESEVLMDLGLEDCSSFKVIR